MRKRGGILALWLAIVVGSAWFVATGLNVVFDITQFLPRSSGIGALLDEVKDSPSSRLLFIGLQGDDEEKLAAASLRLAETLRASGLFNRVDNGSTSYRPDELKVIFDNRYLLSPDVTASRFTEAGLRAALQQRLNDLRSPISVLEKRLLPEDPTGEMVALLRLWLTTEQPDKRGGVWFSADGHRALLLAETRSGGFDAPAQAAAVAAIRTATTANDAGIQLLLGGPGMLATASQDIIRSEVETLSAIATLLIVGLLVLAYRSPRPVLLSLLPVGTGALVAATLVGTTFGSINGITLGFGITLLGVAVDYPIILFSFVRGSEPVHRRLQRVWPVQRLCVALTCIGYLALITPSFAGLSQLGIFAAAGLATAAIVTRYVLPALLSAHWAWAGGNWERKWLACVLQCRLPRARPVALSLLAILLALAFAYPPQWETDLAALSPIPRSILAVDEMLRRDLGAPEAGHMLIIRADDAETALQRSEGAEAYLRQLADRQVIAGYIAPSRFLPSAETQRQRQAALPDPEALREAFGRAEAGLPFKPDLFAPFFTSVERARIAPVVGLTDLADTPLAPVLASLIFPRGSGWTAFVPLKEVLDAAALAAAIAHVPVEGVRYVGIRAETNQQIEQFRRQAMAQLGLGSLAIIVFLAASLRSWRRVTSILLPVALSILVDIMLSTAFGIRLSLLHLISLLLVVGIGIDYSLFFSEPDPDADFRSCTLHAMIVCCLTTLVSFGILSLSSLPVLDAVGTTVAIGVLANFAFAFLLAQPTPARQQPNTANHA